MKIKAIKDFIDKESGERVSADSVIDVSDNRGKEIISKGYAEQVGTWSGEPKRGRRGYGDNEQTEDNA